MAYFEVKMDSASMCGFESFGYFEAESEEALYELDTYQEFEEEMQDYVNGWAEDSDDEEANLVVITINEITEEEYRERMEMYEVERPFSTG